MPARFVWVLFGLCLANCGLDEIPRGRPAPRSEPPPPVDAGVDGATATGLSLGGQVVARDKILVFIHVGHSNMAGRATSPPELRGFNYDVHPQLWRYAEGRFEPAREPLSGDSMTNGRAGPGMSILRAALALAPGYHVVSIGYGQSGQTGGYCRQFRRGGLHYQGAMAPARALAGRVTFAAIFTMFGTSEANDRGNAATFGACMAAMAGEMRADLGEPELPFVMGDWEANSMTSLTPDSSLGQMIIPQLRALPATLPRSAVIPTEMLPIIRNDHHYDFTGHKLWAERGMAILKDRGWAPWARP